MSSFSYSRLLSPYLVLLFSNGQFWCRAIAGSICLPINTCGSALFAYNSAAALVLVRANIPCEAGFTNFAFLLFENQERPEGVK